MEPSMNRHAAPLEDVERLLMPRHEPPAPPAPDIAQRQQRQSHGLLPPMYGLPRLSTMPRVGLVDAGSLISGQHF